MAMVFALLGGALTGIPAKAQDFGIHFLGNTTDNVTGSAGVVPITSWNNVANSTFTIGNSTPIFASDGVTAATLTLTGGGVHNAWSSGLTGDGGDLSRQLEHELTGYRTTSLRNF